MSIIEELKRRNVFKVGVAYLVGSWILVQVADILFDAIGTPEWVMQTMLVFLGIGFFVALFFAWAFELTPEGIKKESEVDRTQSITPQTGKKLNNTILIMMALAIAYLLFDKFTGSDLFPLGQGQQAEATDQEERALTPTAMPAISKPSIAVLPFTNRSRDEDDQFFVEGVHDDLLTNLARIGSLKVISRTSVLRYKDTERPIPEIASELGVATIMEGAVQRSGDHIRINVQLIDAQTDEHLWAEIFDREMTAENLFAIQSEISQKIAAALETTLSPEEQQRVTDQPTDSLEAYDAYLRGRQQMALRTSNSVEQAHEEFQRAVALDPEFALAWASIAENTRWLMNQSTMPIPEGLRIREEAANRALEINPQLGEAYISLAGLDASRNQFEEAEAKFLKAIELSPGFAEAYDWYSDFLAIFPSRRKEALAMARKAEELDPLSPEIQAEIGDQLTELGRYESAERQLQRVIDLNPEFTSGYGLMARLMQLTGRFDEQLLWLRKATELDPGNINRYQAQAWALVDIEDLDGLNNIREKMLEIDDQHFQVGIIEIIDSLAQGNYESALESGKWVDQQIGRLPNFQDFFGWTYVFNGEYKKALDAFAIAYPEYFDRNTWRKGLEQSPSIACYMSWVSQLAGADDAMPELVDISVAYLESELPLYVDHSDRYNDGSCYMLKGDPEKAMDAMETFVAHGHHTQWWIGFKTPIFEPLFGTPKFEAMLTRIREKAAAQRANLAQMEATAGPMSFIEELKRRNVVKVGVAYLVGSWILVQVADILFDAIGTPEWVMQTMLVFLGIGFFVALFFAWAFELTPEGIKKESEVDRTQSITPQTGKKLNNTIVMLLALAVVYLLLDKFSAPEPVSTPAVEVALNAAQQDAAPAAESEVSRQSIAVLPFDNRSNREEDQFFTDGIHDDLLTTIARIGSMKVISRTSVMEYKDTTKKIPEIAKELGVANILEGGIQRSGNQVRINVQLIDAQTDEHLWAEIFDRELTAENLFAIQSEISQRIADALETALSPDEVERINAMPTDNLAAYEAYMRGRQLMATRTTANLALARQDFREAVELDPDFALAWVGLADTVNLQSTYGAVRVQDTFELREDAIQRALAINPELGEAHVSRASLHQDKNEIAEAEAAFKRAIELNPNYATAYMWYGGLLSNSISRTEEWVDLMKKAAELDPRSAIINSSLAGAFAYQGMYSRAEQQYRKNIELNPGFAQGIRALGDFYVFNLGRIDKGIEYHIRSIQADPGSVFGFAIMVMNLVELGDFTNAEIYRQKLADISEDFWMLGWADLTIAHGKNNSGGVEEAWNWLRPKVPPGIPFINEYAALMRLGYGDPLEAREILVQSSPGWLEPQEWAQLIDRTPDTACITAWTLAQTGDEELGQALLDQALAFVERMPTYVEHADNWKIEACYLVAGDTERAMQIIETQLAHNHLFWWKTYHQLPMYEAVRFEPRYQEIQKEVERRLAEQRESVAQMNLGTGP